MSDFVRIAEIQCAAEALFGVSVREQKGACRAKRIVRVRQAAIAVSVDLSGKSLTAIGNAFGGRDHSTVSYAVGMARDDRDVAKLVNELRETVKPIEARSETMSACDEIVSSLPLLSRRALVADADRRNISMHDLVFRLLTAISAERMTGAILDDGVR